MTENVFNALGYNTGGVLSADITDVATSLTLVAGGGSRLPDAPFRLTLTDGSTAGNGVPANAEIILVGMKVGDTLSGITRQYEIGLNGGAARAWVAGTVAIHHQTAGMIQSVIDGLADLQAVIDAGLDADTLDGHDSTYFQVAGDYLTSDNVPMISSQAVGLVVSTTGANDNISVSFTELVVKNGTNRALLSSTSLTINSSALGVNGLDVGTTAMNAWYAVYVIYNGTNKSGLLSLSGTAPTLPTGYTHHALVGWIRTDGTGNKYPLGILQHGKRVQPRVKIGSNTPRLPLACQGVTGTYDPLTPTYAMVSLSTIVPAAAIAVSGTLVGSTDETGVTSAIVAVAPSDEYSGFQSDNPPPATTAVWDVSLVAGAVVTINMPFSFNLESDSIAVCISGAAGAVRILGWELP